MAKILQWNIRGFSIKKEEIRQLVSKFNPLVLCLQETHFKPTDAPVLRNHDFYRYDHVAGQRAQGGVATAIHNSLHSEAVALTTPLQAVAVKIHLRSPITICNVYLPPDSVVSQRDIDDLLAQLSHPFLITGDFNAHNPMWGGLSTNPKGTLVEDTIRLHNVVLLNDGSNTHFTAATGSFSAIDLSLCSPSLALETDWCVHDDLCGSDHFPILIDCRNLPPLPPRQPKWILKKANWTTFRSLAVFDDTTFDEVDAHVDHFTEVVIHAAQRSIPQSSEKPYRVPVPWFTPECKAAIKTRRRALATFISHPTINNLVAFKKLRAKARLTCRQAQQTSWRNYVSTITAQTPSSRVFDKIRKISGKLNFKPIAGLLCNGVLATSQQEIADALGAQFSRVSSSANYTAAFKGVKQSAERKVLDFRASSQLNYNLPFSEWELESALKAAKDTSPGLDLIHYQMIKHLSSDSKSYLLALFNKIWLGDCFPTRWRVATIIPILKAGKDKSDPSSYRPIALTSCMCKLLERMINARLIWFLESKGLLCVEQSGFRRNRSVMDNLVQLEGLIQDTFIQRQHLIAVFFDLEKAYDTTWKYGILRAMHRWGFRGHLPLFVQNFMADRTFHVRVGNTLSESFAQENGVPQGAVLSVTLFAIAINSITSCIRSPVRASLYVDDLAIFYRTGNLNSAQRQLQLTINRLQGWADLHGFRFSSTKTSCMHFSRHRSFHPHPVLSLSNNVLPFTETVRFLGMVFDEKLNWLPHLRQLKTKCLKSLNILKILSGTSWGADRTSMLRLYRSLIRSKLEFGCAVYASARKSYIGILDPVHNAGIRLCTGAFRTSPVPSLYCESGEAPLTTRRDYLLGSYISKLRGMSKHPTFQTVFRPSYQPIYNTRQKATRPVGIRAKELVETLEMDLPPVLPVGTSRVAPWSFPKPTCLMQLAQHPKAQTSPSVFRQLFGNLCATYQHHTKMYTDGSKDSSSVGCAFAIGNTSVSFKLNPMCSVYTAELFAILKALEHIKRASGKQFMICSDSMSSLQSLCNAFPTDHLVQSVQNMLGELSLSGIEVLFCWLPGHVGITGNEMADRAAKDASRKIEVDCATVPVTDLKAVFRSKTLQRWQSSWDSVLVNKLKTIKATVQAWQSSARRSRREEVVTTRMRIGHSFLTHVFILKREEPPMCTSCDQPLSIKHILVECAVHRQLRRRLNLPLTMKEVLRDDDRSVDRVLRFLRETGFYSSI
jgi:exonuclease III/ribonuclease HI